MGELDKLLQCDSDNIMTSRKNLELIEPSSLTLIDLCADALRYMIDEFGKVCNFDNYQDKLESACNQIPGYNKDVLRLIYDSEIIGNPSDTDPYYNAYKALLEQRAIFARVLLSLRIRREYLFSISDLLRLRVSASMGVLRTQAETAALIQLIADDSSLGKAWLSTIDNDKGKDFYRHNQRKINQCINKLGFTNYYQLGSNMALHARASGIALGYLQSKSLADNSGSMDLVYQETNKPEELLFWYCSHMQFYRILVAKASIIFPELDLSFHNDSAISGFLDLEATVQSHARRLHGK